MEAVQAAITSAALIVGGIWTYTLFVKRRQKYPRALITHEVIENTILPGTRIVHVVVTVENVGDVLLELVSGETRLQQIVPPSKSVVAAIEAGKDPVSENQSTIGWPLLGLREFSWKEGEYEIEPGEKDEQHCDFAIGSDTKTFQVYTYLKNRLKKRREIGWSCTTIHHTHHRSSS